MWYHLGLSYFLLGMYDKADWAYTRCAALNKTADDICAVTDWHYMTLKRLGKDEEAAKLLDEITEDMPVSDEVANSYYQRLRVYKGCARRKRSSPTRATMRGWTLSRRASAWRTTTA